VVLHFAAFKGALGMIVYLLNRWGPMVPVGPNCTGTCLNAWRAGLP